jgi:hypothetical protein
MILPLVTCVSHGHRRTIAAVNLLFEQGGVASAYAGRFHHPPGSSFFLREMLALSKQAIKRNYIGYGGEAEKQLRL